MSVAAPPYLSHLPPRWDARRLRFVTQLNPSKQETKNRPPDEPVSFVPMDAVGEWGGIRLDEARPLGDLQAGYTFFRDGDVVTAKVTPCFENGKGALASNLVGGIAFGTTELHVLRAGARLDPRFLFYLTISHAFRAIGASEMYGAGGQKRVPEWFFRDFVAPVPPLDAQLRIVAFLDRRTAAIDQVIQKKGRLIELLEEERQALVTRAVTRGLDPAARMQHSGLHWLGEIPAHWRVLPLSRLIRSGSSITYGIVQAGPHHEGGIPYIRTSDMSGDRLPLSGYPLTSPEVDAAYQRSKVAAGDVVVAIRATVGKALLVPPGLEGANLTQGTAKVSPGPDLVGDFLILALRATPSQQRFEALAKGATFKEITLEMLRKFPIPVPPVMEQSALAAAVLERDENLRLTSDRLCQSREALKEYRQALISAAVTGQVDVTRGESA